MIAEKLTPAEQQAAAASLALTRLADLIGTHTLVAPMFMRLDLDEELDVSISVPRSSFAHWAETIGGNTWQRHQSPLPDRNNVWVSGEWNGLRIRVGTTEPRDYTA